MTWGKFVRLNGIEQTLKRRVGQDSLASLSNKDVTVLLFPPINRGKNISTPDRVRRQLAKREKETGEPYALFKPKKPRQIWPEERLIWEVYRRNPLLKKLPYDLDSFEPPFAKRFALRQLELMREGMTKEKAYQDTQKEMAALKEYLVKRSVNMEQQYSVIATIQEDEERELAAAYSEYKKINS